MTVACHRCGPGLDAEDDRLGALAPHEHGGRLDDPGSHRADAHGPYGPRPRGAPLGAGRGVTGHRGGPGAEPGQLVAGDPAGELRHRAPSRHHLRHGWASMATHWRASGQCGHGLDVVGRPVSDDAQRRRQLRDRRYAGSHLHSSARAAGQDRTPRHGVQHGSAGRRDRLVLGHGSDAHGTAFSRSDGRSAPTCLVIGFRAGGSR